MANKEKDTTYNLEHDTNNVCDILSNYSPSLFTTGVKTDNDVSECFSQKERPLNLLSLFSGCGGMDIGFEGGFICHKKSISTDSEWIEKEINDDWVKLKSTRFRTVFANDILDEARNTWCHYMSRRGHDMDVYHFGSIVDYVKLHNNGNMIFPQNIDILTGGFPCQDFSVAGKRMGFDSKKNHNGKVRTESEPTEETRGKLYYWMKQVIDITHPKVFIAENVKGLTNLGDVKDVIQRDFASADGNGYIVLSPQVLHAADYGVPESRERVIFIGLRRKDLRSEVIRILESGEIPDKYNPYPKPTHGYTTSDRSLLDPVVCMDVLRSLKEPSESNDLSQRHYSKAKYMGAHCQGQKEIDLGKIGPTIRSEHHGNIEYRRLSVEHGGMYVNELQSGLQERRLTPRECALIQTFPPDYTFVRRNGYDGKGKFIVSASGAYKVIGNAVPPMLAFNIAIRLQSIWDDLFL